MDPTSSLAPEPAAVDPVAPVAPVDPVAPNEPKTPVAELSPEDKQLEAEDKEWDDAADELFPGIKSAKKDGKKDEPAKPGEAPKKTETPEDAAKKDGEVSGEEDDPDEPAEEVAEPDTAARSARVAAREAAKQVEAVAVDVRKQMFADVPTQLQDADGDPINGIEDVMKLMNPQTGEPFTAEEAGMWLLSAQQQFNQNMADTEKQIEQIAEVNVDIKDQADSVAYNYGELLKAMPELRDELWTEYEKTLVKDEKSGIITKAPVSLETFYRMALQPYMKLAAQLEAQEAAQPVAPPPDPKEEAAKRSASRADRSDIYGGGNTDVTDPEDAEWGAAAETVFGNIKR